MPAGVLPPDIASGPPSRHSSVPAWVMLGGAGCLFVPVFLLASLFMASRCPFTWMVGGLFTFMILLGIWPLSAFIVFIGDRLSRPSGAGALNDVMTSVEPFAESKAASAIVTGTPMYGGNIQTPDPNVFRGSDIEMIRNRRVRRTVFLALGLAIGLPLSLALTRTNVDANGLPISPSPSELLARPEAQLLPPGAATYNQQVYAATCSPQGDVYVDASSPQAPNAVYLFYDQWLRGHGWKLSARNPTVDVPYQPSIDVEYVKGSREKVALTVGSARYAPEEGSGVPPAMPDGTNSTFQMHYSIAPYVAPSPSAP